MSQAPEGWSGVEEKLLEGGPELRADQAVEHRVEAAVGVSQAHSQGECISLHIVESLAEGHKVKLYEHPPQSQRLVGQPAQKEGENHDDDGFGDFGAPVLPTLLAFYARCTGYSSAEDQAQ